MSFSNACATPWTAAHQAPLSTEFSRQKYWSGLLFPSLGDPPNLGMEPEVHALQAGFFTVKVWLPWSFLKMQIFQREDIG